MNPINKTRWGHVEILSRDFTSQELDAAIKKRPLGVVAEVPPDTFVSVISGAGGIKKASVNSCNQEWLIVNKTSDGSLDALFIKISDFFTSMLPRLLLKNHRVK